jgi:hypothetical protein
MIAATKGRILREAGAIAPSITLVMPFEPTMRTRGELEITLKRLLATAEKELLTRFEAADAVPVIRSAQELVKTLNYSTHRKSLAIHVAPAEQKVCYMNLPVEEGVLTGRPFHMREIMQFKRLEKSYLLLLLSAKKSKMYWAGGDQYRLIKSNVPQSMFAYINDVPERVANFSDPEHRREFILNKFLHHMDEGLAGVLAMYPLPVFVMGAERVVGHFSKITRHTRFIAGYIYKDWADSKISDLRNYLSPALTDWQKVRRDLLQHQLEEALSAGKLVTGLHEVRKSAGCRNSRLLILEENKAGKEGEIETGIDLIVQKVLENGGDIEEAEPGMLEKFGRIALIRYY